MPPVSTSPVGTPNSRSESADKVLSNAANGVSTPTATTDPGTA